MLLRALLPTVALLCAIPALARDKLPAISASEPPASADAIVAISDVRLDAAFDEKTTPGSKEAMLDLAREGYQKALKQEPKNPNAMLGIARFYARIGEKEKAVEAYKKYLTAFPKDAKAAQEVAISHARWKDWEGACAWCQFALKIDPENRDVKKTLGFCLARSGKWDEAFATLCQIMPEAQARHNLAGLLDHMGHTDASKQQLQLAIKADPNYVISPAAPVMPAAVPQPVPPVALPVPQAAPVPCVVYELRLVKVRPEFCTRIGIKLTRDVTLTDAQLRTLLEAAQGDRDANVMLAPKVTVDDGESAEVKVGDYRTFVTGVDAVKSRGAALLVPRNTSTFLGHVLKVQGRVSADGGYVHTQASVEYTRLSGAVETLPLATKITPVFEGGSQGQPVPFTQNIQVPDIRKEHVERSAVVPSGGTLVIGSWKETEEAKEKGGKAKEFEVIALATVRMAKPVQPTARVSEVFKLRNVAAADVADALQTHMQKHGQGAAVVVIAEPVSNCVLVNAEKEWHAKLRQMIEALDKAPTQVMVQALVLEVADGFLENCGLNADGPVPTFVLTPRETQMLTACLRAAKEKGTLDVLSRPQIQVADGQTGLVEIGQQYPVQTAGGAVEHKQIGLTMRVTPKVAPDGKSVLLNAEARHTSVSPSVVQTKLTFLPGTVLPFVTLAPVPVFNTQAIKSNTNVPAGHTVVTCTTEKRLQITETAGGVRSQSAVRVQKLVILTPYIVQPEKPNN